MKVVKKDKRARSKRPKSLVEKRIATSPKSKLSIPYPSACGTLTSVTLRNALA